LKLRSKRRPKKPFDDEAGVGVGDAGGSGGGWFMTTTIPPVGI
jgi:hypothetical protein